MQQANSEVEANHDSRKYEVGQRLCFVEYNPQETYKAKPGVEFQPGDVLEVEPRNGCGMGIDVRRVSDGAVDMIWPEEVSLLLDEAGGARK